MSRHILLISVRFHQGWYHGERSKGTGQWPPSPARLFQALVAGASCGRILPATDLETLKWLEHLDPPVIAAPSARLGQAYTNFVPNNDRDQVEGGSKAINDIRRPKTIRTHIFDVATPLLFAWVIESEANEDKAHSICRIAEKLYQLGRGIDMAWAWGEILSLDEGERRLAQHRGTLYRPGKGNSGDMLLCPKIGSLDSLRKRYSQPLLTYKKVGHNTVSPIVSRPLPPLFDDVLYDVPSRHLLFELRAATRGEPYMPWPSTRAAELVVDLRDRASDRLKRELRVEVGKVDRVLIGRKATETDKAARVRIVPLPSIGHTHADRAIRRVLVEVPPNCPIPADHIASAFSGLSQFDQTTGEIEWNLVRSDERRQLVHYGLGDARDLRVWRTVTPAALPIMRPRRNEKNVNRVAGEAKAALAVIQALRHEGVTVPVESIRVQREPFEANGARAEEFAVAGRFASRDLHHVEIRFTHPVRTPLVIGNGRYLGLGLMAPTTEFDDVFAVNLDSAHQIAPQERPAIVRSLRRALMSLACDDAGRVGRLFSGHERDGRPAGTGNHAHVFLAVDGTTNDNGSNTRLIVAAPWAVDRRFKPQRDDRRLFDRVTRQLRELRAGPLGRFDRLTAESVENGDPIVGPARIWIGQAPYVATRNLKKRDDPAAAIKEDVVAECVRRGLPTPAEIDVLEVSVGPRGGRPTAKLKLRFAVAIRGPLLLGRDSHAGGGLFHALPHGR